MDLRIRSSLFCPFVTLLFPPGGEGGEGASRRTNKTCNTLVPGGGGARPTGTGEQWGMDGQVVEPRTWQV